MADPLYELLAPYFDETSPSSSSSSSAIARPSIASLQATNYFTRLSTLSLGELTTTEPASLLHSVQSHIRNLQALSKRSHKAVISSTSHLTSLTSLLPSLESQSAELQSDLPDLDNAAAEFARKYDRSTENAVLDRRKRAMLLVRNVDRITDVLDLPNLLSSTVSAAQSASSTSSTSTSSAATAYAAALDLHAHVKRLNGLYPHSEVVGNITKQAEVEIQNLTTILITSLQGPTLKLASAMRAIGWLKRVAPDLADDGHGSAHSQPTSTKAFSVSTDTASADGSLGALFLVCRLRTLHDTLEALEPLRELADQETRLRKPGVKSVPSKQQTSTSTVGGQSERYLKRYVEIFREQSFSIVSMYKSIFPSGLPTAESSTLKESTMVEDDATALSLPSPLSSFALHLVDMLTVTLQVYIPNITDKQARESLLTQVLYCAGSLGRLGADFGMMLALLEDDMKLESTPDEDGDHAEDRDPEWVQVMKKHRTQASRLEVLARGVGTGKKKSTESQSPTVLSPG